MVHHQNLVVCLWHHLLSSPRINHIQKFKLPGQGEQTYIMCRRCWPSALNVSILGPCACSRSQHWCFFGSSIMFQAIATNRLQCNAFFKILNSGKLHFANMKGSCPYSLITLNRTAPAVIPKVVLQGCFGSDECLTGTYTVFREAILLISLKFPTWPAGSAAGALRRLRLVILEINGRSQWSKLGLMLELPQMRDLEGEKHQENSAELGQLLSCPRSGVTWLRDLHDSSALLEPIQLFDRSQTWITLLEALTLKVGFKAMLMGKVPDQTYNNFQLSLAGLIKRKVQAAAVYLNM